MTGWVAKILAGIALAVIGFFLQQALAKLSQLEKDIISLRIEVARLAIPSDDHIREIARQVCMEVVRK